MHRRKFLQNLPILETTELKRKNMFKWYKLNFFRKITIWHRWNKKSNCYEFNHIESKWSKKDRPVGHPSWKSGDWLSLYGYLDYKSRVIRATYNPIEGWFLNFHSIRHSFFGF